MTARTITTAAELAALTPDECVRDRMGDVGVVRDGHIYYPETAPQTLERAARKYGPFLVLPLHAVQSVADALPHVTLEDAPDGSTARASVVDDAVGRLTRSLAATEDDAIRRQLVALGWTPPGTAALHAPASSVVPEAAVEAAREAFYEPIELSTALGAEAHRENSLRRFRAALTAALPHLAAVPSAEHIARTLAESTALTGADARLVVQAAVALSGPSATREELTGVINDAAFEGVEYDRAERVAAYLFARFTITPRTDR